MKKVHHPLRWIIWLLASLFYFYEYFLRVLPSVIVSELQDAFQVGAAAIGALSAFYFYIYAPMQIPVGVMTDRYGARKLLAIAAAIAGLGALLFAYAHSYWLAGFGRLLMGGGSAFGFIGLVYICTHWFSEKKRGILIGLGSSIGTLGAVMGEGPLRIAIDHFGWRLTTMQLGVFGLILGAVIYFVVRNDPPEVAKYHEKLQEKAHPHILHNLGAVTKLGYSWLIAAVSLFLYVATPGLGALWGIPFIHTVYGISTELAGFTVSMMFVGWMFGGPLIGRYSDKLKSKKLPMLICAFLGMIVVGIIVWVPHIPLFLLFALFFFLGFFSGGQLLTYSYAIDITPDFAKATAAAFTNCAAIVGGALAQPFVGFLIQTKWTGIVKEGAQVYTPAAYKFAMSVFPIFFLIAFVLTLFLKRLKIKQAS